MQAILYILVLLVATFLLGYVFYKKDYHPQPIAAIAQAFGMGFFAMIPIFGYKFIYQNFLPLISEYELLSFLTKSSLLSGFLYFILNFALLSLVLFVLSSVLTILLTIFDHDILHNIKKSLKEEELGFVAVSVFVGILVYFISLLEHTLGISLMRNFLSIILFLTIIEEYVKHLVVRFMDDKKLVDIDDAITLSVMVGLAFGVAETIVYAVVSGDLSLILYRSLLSLPIHVVASGIFGYFYGLSHFSKLITEKTTGEKTYLFNIKWLHKALTFKKSTVYKEEKIIEGLSLATLFHAGCNVLFELNLAFLVVPAIISGFFILSLLYKESHIFYKLIHTTSRKKKSIKIKA